MNTGSYFLRLKVCNMGAGLKCPAKQRGSGRPPVPALPRRKKGTALRPLLPFKPWEVPHAVSTPALETRNMGFFKCSNSIKPLTAQKQQPGKAPPRKRGLSTGCRQTPKQYATLNPIGEQIVELVYHISEEKYTSNFPIFSPDNAPFSFFDPVL